MTVLEAAGRVHLLWSRGLVPGKERPGVRIGRAQQSARFIEWASAMRRSEALQLSLSGPGLAFPQKRPRRR